MKKINIEKLFIQICGNLPLDFTFYEKDGFCKNSNEFCKYCEKNNKDSFLCNKKTYTLDFNNFSVAANVY